MSLKDLIVVTTVPNLPSHCIDILKDTFKELHIHYDTPVPSDLIPKVDLWLTSNKGLPPVVPSFEAASSTKLVQLISAGSDKALATPQIQEYIAKLKSGDVKGKKVWLAKASGVHVGSIPNYAVGMAINIYQQIPYQVQLGKSDKRWHTAAELGGDDGPLRMRSTRGKTAGLLGYGALGRETARLLKGLGMNIIAANTSGKATKQDGYIIPGTGDADGSIPSKYYTTSDPASLEEFLKSCDVLVCSLPKSPQTTYLLDRQKLGLLRPNAAFINVGRGSLIRSEELLAALDVPGAILGAAIDVTDPEPLPDNHPLWSHPKLLITPHITGDVDNEMDLVVDLFIANVKRVVNGEEPFNQIDLEKGY